MINAKTKRIVIKVGSNALAKKDEMKIDEKYISSLVKKIVKLRKEKKEVIIVSSGAVLRGMEMLKITDRPTHINELQALSGIGQPSLMNMYHKSFKKFKINIGQILITDHTIKIRKEKKSFTSTVSTLLKNGIIPIINENDVVAVEELRIGDNDVLSAYATIMLKANLLIILSDVDGLYDKNPKYHDAKLIKKVTLISDDIKKLADGMNTKGVGTGGMSTKIKAADICLQKNIPMVIMNAKNDWQWDNFFKGKDFGGTIFSKK